MTAAAILFLGVVQDITAATTRASWINFQFFQHVKKTYGVAIAYLELSGASESTVWLRRDAEYEHWCSEPMGDRDAQR